eukprot:scaffold1305_cov374-Prasinococcus_capsulatus_cf.AAC.11
MLHLGVMAPLPRGDTRRCRNEEVSHLLLIYLQEADLHLIAVGRAQAQELKNLLRHARDETTSLWSAIAHHSVRLARSGLPVGEDGHVVALEELLEAGHAHLGEEGRLAGCWIAHQRIVLHVVVRERVMGLVHALPGHRLGRFEGVSASSPGDRALLFDEDLLTNNFDDGAVAPTLLLG